VKELLGILHKPESLITHVGDRKGHDRRYAIDASRARAELGWEPRMDFAKGLRETVEWYRTHTAWCSAVTLSR
jgi:dTDP-glucose 4,6-dehydratase